MRLRIIVGLAEGSTPTELHDHLGVARSTVYRVATRFSREGVRGLRDRRPEMPARLVTDAYLERLGCIVYEGPQEHGWQRTTWTRELLARQLEVETGIRVHPTHIGRLLHALQIRWKRARPVALKAVSKRTKQRHSRRIRRLLENLGDDEVALYEDEVDVHLNPKIGPCWTPRGVQFEVETPGQNVKRYVVGGLNPVTGEIVWVTADRKDSFAFVVWLRHVARIYEGATIHVILDNYGIHKSRLAQRALAELGCIELHFLPPYSPELNRIERLWGEVHANVTRNHRCKDIDELMAAVDTFLTTAQPYPGSRPSLARTV
jgi:transposase